jgi:RNA polymerase subunit RPABC4/transcription elongation factor Spt4
MATKKKAPTKGGMKKCPECGYMVPKTATICKSCGYKFPTAKGK